MQNKKFEEFCKGLKKIEKPAHIQEIAKQLKLNISTVGKYIRILEAQGKITLKKMGSNVVLLEVKNNSKRGTDGSKKTRPSGVKGLMEIVHRAGELGIPLGELIKKAEEAEAKTQAPPKPITGEKHGHVQPL